MWIHSSRRVSFIYPGTDERKENVISGWHSSLLCMGTEYPWSRSLPRRRKEGTSDEVLRTSPWEAMVCWPLNESRPSLNTKWPNDVIRMKDSHFLLSGQRPQIMVWNSVKTFAWLLMLRKLQMEKSDKLNINQMDMLFFDLRSFMPVSETLYSRKNT